jgi:ABC-2 type transport system permease protein
VTALSHSDRHGGGPAAFGDDLRRFWNLTWTLAVTDFKLRFFGSALGYLWTLVRPLMLFGVLYFVFTEVVDIGGDVKYYPVYLLTGIVLYGYFSEMTATGLQSLVARENLLRKMRFPRLVIPLSVSLTAFFNLGTSLLAVLFYALGSGVPVRWSWLEMVPLILILTVLGVGLTMLLSALYVRYRDINPIWDVALQLLFYASPILYVLSVVPDKYERAMLINPIAVVLTQMRHAVLDPSAPSAAYAVGPNWRLLIPFGIVVGTFVLGLWFFLRETPRIAENL